MLIMPGVCQAFASVAALWSPAVKGLTSWHLFATFVFLSLSHVVSWVMCST